MDRTNTERRTTRCPPPTPTHSPPHFVKDIPIKVDESGCALMGLDCLVRNRSLLEVSHVDLGSQFLKELKDSVGSMLTADRTMKKDTRVKVMSAFDLLIYRYTEGFE